MAAPKEPGIKDQLKRLTRPLRHALIIGFLGALDRLMRSLPLGVARKLGSSLGRLAYRLIPYERRKTRGSLSQAFPEKDAAWVDETAAGVFGGLGQAAVDFFRMADFGPKDLDAWVASVEGFEHVSEPLSRGQGVVAVTAHLAHWELLAAWVAARAPVSVVARQAFNASLDAALNARRERLNVHVFGRNTAVRPILKWLKEGKVLGVLADQDTGVDSLYVDFFGRLAKTPSGPAFLAQVTGAALVTGFCFREPDGRYRFRFEAAIPVAPRGDGGAMELWPAVQEYTRRTEAAIREQPQHWAWNHARWRSDIDKASTGWDPRLASACRALSASQGKS